MIRTIGFPGRYIQGPRAIDRLEAMAEELGCLRPLVLVDAAIRQAVWEPIENRLREAGLKVCVLEFPGECTVPIIQSLTMEARRAEADCVIGFGGGKTIDTAKGVARACGARLMIVPTIASNDSPTSRLIVLYDDKHQISDVQMMHRNPDAIIVDTAIVARAPARFFAAGLGDALSKKDETEQCREAGGKNFFGTQSLDTAVLFGRQCYQTIADTGLGALEQIRNHQAPDDNVERVVEATVLLSGLAFESGGLSVAHALTRGFSAQPAMSAYLHGEMVAFGSIVQKFAQRDSLSSICQHADLVSRLGLPVCFADFNGFEPDRKALEDIATATCHAPYAANVVPKADVHGIIDALSAADALGRSLRPTQREPSGKTGSSTAAGRSGR